MAGSRAAGRAQLRWAGHHAHPAQLKQVGIPAAYLRAKGARESNQYVAFASWATRRPSLRTSFLYVLCARSGRVVFG